MIRDGEPKARAPKQPKEHLSKVLTMRTSMDSINKLDDFPRVTQLDWAGTETQTLLFIHPLPLRTNTKLVTVQVLEACRSVCVRLVNVLKISCWSTADKTLLHSWFEYDCPVSRLKEQYTRQTGF